MGTEPIVFAILGAGGSLVWFWYDKKKQDKRLDDINALLSALNNKQIEHENKFTTESHVRQILREEIATVKDELSEIKLSQKEVKKDVNDLVVQVGNFITEIRIENSVKERLEELNKR